MSPSTKAPSFSTPEELLSTFAYERILSSDPRSNTICILGTALPTSTSIRAPAIIRLVKSPYSATDAISLLTASPSAFSKLEMVLSNAEYSTMLGWQALVAEGRGADLQLFGICPATEKHIKKYSTQESRMLCETPEVYQKVVEPHIEGIPKGAIEWVYRILDGSAEAENVIYRDEDPQTGFVVTPDLKWDQTTLESIYLLVMTQNKSIRSIRDLRTEHLELLRKIRSETERCARVKYGMGKGQLRLFVHYQPTYYHFHVHVTHISNAGFLGSTVGQAYLLDEIIDNLTLFRDYYKKKTFFYSLGTEHALFAGLTAAAGSD